MFSYIDENYEKERLDKKFKNFFGAYSSEVRKQLMSKNLKKITSLYDIYYPEVRNDLLAKNNKVFDTNLEESSIAIRNTLLAKQVSEHSDLEKISENFRKSILAREKMHQGTENLLKQSEEIRKNATAKNLDSDFDLMKESESIRRQSLAKNKTQSYFKDREEDKSGTYRENQTAKNVKSEADLEDISKEYRKNSLTHNKTTESNLEKISHQFRKDNLARNTKQLQDLESSSKQHRVDDVARNAPTQTDLAEISEQFRKDNVASNDNQDTNLEKLSEGFRKDDLAQNKTDTTDLEKNSEAYRKDDLSKNKSTKSDLETNSVAFRTDDLSKNMSKSSDLEKMSEEFREDDISKNKSVSTNLEENSKEFRKNDISLNASKDTNLENDSNTYRKDNLSLNQAKTADLEENSNIYRADDLSKNKSVESDLESISESHRKDDLSKNKSTESDLEKDSEAYRKVDLAQNKAVTTDLEKDSETYRKDDLAQNKSISSDLENDSPVYRADDLSQNEAVETDLETDSKLYREDDLSKNASVTTDLEKDSEAYRKDDLSKNEDIQADLEADSKQYRDDDLAKNTGSITDLETDSKQYRDDDLANNAESESDLDTNSEQYRKDNLTKNVSIESDLEDDFKSFRISSTKGKGNRKGGGDLLTTSENFRLGDLSKNVSTSTNLLLDSVPYLKEQLSHNSGGLFGVNISALGTSTFIGISRVWTMGLLFRNLMMLRNVPKSIDLEKSSRSIMGSMVTQNKYTYYWNRYNYSTSPSLLEDTKKPNIASLPYTPPDELEGILGYQSPIQYSLENIARSIEYSNKSPYQSFNTLLNTQEYFGISDEPSRKVQIAKGDAADVPVDDVNITYMEGRLTNIIRRYNVEANPYILNISKFNGYSPGEMGASVLNAYAANEAIPLFGDLIEKTIGAFDKDLKYADRAKSIVADDEGNYVKGEADKLLKTEGSLAAKSTAGNPLDDVDFKTGRKGVKKILKDISESSINFAENFRNIQGIDGPRGANYNGKEFVIGMKNNAKRVSKQRFTIKNPYAPSREAAKLIFYFKNYSINGGETIYFPPYIQSFQNTANASWNENLFLGRPEPVYTYNNSSRNGSITFYVLTDYSQRVLIGRDYGSGNIRDHQAIRLNRHFTDYSKKDLEIEMLKKQKAGIDKQVENYDNDIGDIDDEINKMEERINEINAEIPTATAEQRTNLKEERRTLKQTIRELKSQKPKDAEKSKSKEDLQVESNSLNDEINEQEILSKDPNYSESSDVIGNIYMSNITQPSRENGDVVTTLADTITRLNQMNQGLMFQPAFFSGDDVDFERRVEFLEKLTRPARNIIPDTGFMFTRPPIAHIGLGTWFNHDIVVNSVSYDYADAPWSFNDKGLNGKLRAQPMWVSVTVQFNIIGPWGIEEGDPPLSTDKGGYYGPKR